MPKNMESGSADKGETQEEILDAIELTPKEVEYEDAREVIEKKYNDKKTELETAKLEFDKQKLTGYPYSQLEGAIRSQEAPERYGFRDEDGKEVWEMVKHIMEEEKENENYRRRTTKDILLKLTRSEKE